MKKLINKPETVVREMCHGIALAHPELELIAKHKIIRRKVCWMQLFAEMSLLRLLRFKCIMLFVRQQQSREFSLLLKTIAVIL
ncbi:hypothetical protein [Anaerocolumna aminovalerica]|uniref:hypothetical protein n=1 Tax=Anaerocolumna aminovalerica TaxID=1527 RepID=UPI002ED5EC6F